MGRQRKAMVGKLRKAKRNEQKKKETKEEKQRKQHQPRFFFVGISSCFVCALTLSGCLFVQCRRARTVLLELCFPDVLLLSDVVAAAMVCH
jgi:hypothetical protein